MIVCLGECSCSDCGLIRPYPLKEEWLPYLYFWVTILSDFLLIVGTKLNLLSSY